MLVNSSTTVKLLHPSPSPEREIVAQKKSLNSLRKIMQQVFDKIRISSQVF